MEIALFHLYSAAEHLGMESEVMQDKEAQKRTMGGYEYIASLKIKEV